MSLDDQLYDIVAKEIRSGTLVDGLYTRAFAEANGDKDKAQAKYIKLRVAQLRQEAKVRAEKQEAKAKAEQIAKSDALRRFDQMLKAEQKAKLKADQDAAAKRAKSVNRLHSINSEYNTKEVSGQGSDETQVGCLKSCLISLLVFILILALMVALQSWKDA